MLLIFSDKMMANLAVIDCQHQKIVTAFNDLCAILSSGDKNLSKQKFADFMQFAVFHFAFEQTLMLHSNYPKVKTYIKTHNNLLERVMKFYMRFEADDKNAVPEFINFMENWLKSHLPLEAGTYIAHINEYLAQMNETQKDEYLQKLKTELQDLSITQIQQKMSDLIIAYNL